MALVRILLGGAQDWIVSDSCMAQDGTTGRGFGMVTGNWGIPQIEASPDEGNYSNLGQIAPRGAQ
jgi:hypothetical protein